MNISSWLTRFMKPLPLDKRQAVIDGLAPSAAPGFDFFLLVILSCSIATLGLITDSAAVIIGAMLLAPLMTPLIGIGMASIEGDSRLLKGAFLTLLEGIFLAIFLALVISLVNNYLPIVSLQQLPAEITARTRPTPIDLVIALAGGLAAAYALTQPNLSAALPGVAIATALMPPLCTIGIGIAIGRWDVAGGASLLFITNAVAISFASVLVFFLRGFGTTSKNKGPRLPRSLLLSALLTATLLIPLTYYSIKFFQDAAENNFIQSIVTREVNNLGNAELVDVSINHNGSTLDMLLTLQTNSSISYQQVVNLQAALVKEINLPISLKVNTDICRTIRSFDSSDTDFHCNHHANPNPRTKSDANQNTDRNRHQYIYLNYHGNFYADTPTFIYFYRDTSTCSGRGDCHIITRYEALSDPWWTGDWHPPSRAGAYHPLPDRNPERIGVGQCYGCGWQIRLDPRDLHSHSYANGYKHSHSNSNHHPNIYPDGNTIPDIYYIRHHHYADCLSISMILYLSFILEAYNTSRIFTFLSPSGGEKIHHPVDAG